MSKVLSILVEYIPDVKREYFAPFHSKGKTKVGEEILKKSFLIFIFVCIFKNWFPKLILRGPNQREIPKIVRMDSEET